MYLDDDIGILIRSLRREKGITQDMLSDNLCAPCTISRIENGSQKPRSALFQNIMERLGEPGFFRGIFYETGNLDEIACRREIIEALENDRMERFEWKIHEYCSLFDMERPATLQFARYMMLLGWCEMYENPEVFFLKAMEILKITRKNYSIEDLDRGFLPDGLELLILNGMSLALTEKGDFDGAARVFKQLCVLVNPTRHFLPSFWKIKASVYNNLAVFAMKKEKLDNAKSCMDFAVKSASMEGGHYFFLKILRTRMKLYLKMNNEREAAKDLVHISRGLSLIKGSSPSEYGINEFLKQKKGLMIF